MKDKVVIITGASSGIGKALAFSFGREGAKIVITGRKETPLMEVSQELTKAGIDNFAFVSDVRIEADNILMVEKTVEKYGKIDILINNAGISMRSMFADCDLNVIKQVMDINFYGTVYATKYALPYIKETKGSIVGVSSIAGFSSALPVLPSIILSMSNMVISIMFPFIFMPPIFIDSLDIILPSDIMCPLFMFMLPIFISQLSL